ncbi:MAG TPA: amidohydrolase family protein [Acidimicrobiales bacterium]|nr:amidohydrolase family protein [Acidimicrobiales bacterium]
MPADLVIRGARIIDGTGRDGYTADVEVRDGRIASIGRGTDAALEAIDADGLVLTPGFVDIHTHYDAQLMFEPSCSPSSWHGVTTVVIGNCGFSLAPAKPQDLDFLIQSLARVEGMSTASLAAGVDFTGGSMRDLLDRFEGRIGVNVVQLVGHCAVRRWVMGDDASERVATAAEIEAMTEVLEGALVDGGYGFSSSQLDVHADHEGRPVPSNLASPEELVALSDVLSRYPGSVIEFTPNTSLPGYSEADRQLVCDIAQVSHAPVNVNMIDWFPGFTDGWQRNLTAIEAANAAGLRVYPMLRANPQDMFFCFADTFIFDDVPSVRDALVLSGAERDRALRDPSLREVMRNELATIRRSVNFEWDRITVAATAREENRHLEGMPAPALADARGVDVLDAVLDLALDEDLATVFRIDRQQGPAHVEFRKRMAQHPLLMAGASDAGAHLQTFCGADYPTRVLKDLVPDPLTLEQAVYKLTGQPAAMLGLSDRGVIREGAYADLVLFDPARLGVVSTRFLDDFPAGARRLVHEPTGYEAIIVNGTTIVRDGKPTGELPGRVLRRPS